MKKIIGFALLFIISVMMSFMPSEFYSSLTKVDYVEGSKTLKFTTKLNSAHLAEVLKTNPNTSTFETELKKYMNGHFDFYINGQDAPLTFTGSQVDGETTWIYFEANNVSDISSLKIKNNIMLEAYPKQLNLVNIAYKGVQKNMTFMRGREVNEVSF